MGLLYIMPKSEKEANQISSKNGICRISSYSLPFIFWIYFAIGFVVISAMSLPAIPILKKLLLATNVIDQLMGLLTALTLTLLPISGLCFLFYRKSISIKIGENTLFLEHYLFGVKVSKRELLLKELEVKHFLSSPNMAKINNSQDSRAFENRGHFLLLARLQNGKEVTLDRHTNKADLIGLEKLILSKIKFNPN